MEPDKENDSSKVGPRGKKTYKKPTKVQSKEAKLKESNNSVTDTVGAKDARLKESNNSLTSAQKPEVKTVHGGFWSKKLQDLEKSPIKNKKSELYEFSFTEDSDASFKVKKKPRKKGTAPKKRQVTQPKYKKPVKKANKPPTSERKTDSQPLPKKDATTGKETRKSTHEHKSITLAGAALQAAAITSTPAVNRKNLLDPSNFLFLSPIIKEESECFNEVKEDPPAKQNSGDCVPVAQFDQETPKIETRLKRFSCRRVLRSGKMLSK